MTGTRIIMRTIRCKLDDSRFGCLVSSGPVVEDCGDG